MTKLFEGGNVQVLDKSTGKLVDAERLDLRKIGRQEFIKKFTELFKKMNKDFKSKYGEPIWRDESLLTNGFVFNGSTSYIMDQSLSDEEVVKFKPSAGDIDITVSLSIKEDLWRYLDSIEGKEIIKGARYVGSNKPSISSIGSQINAVIVVDFDNGVTAPAQVDFEFVPFSGGRPTEWAKFSHGSSFTDAKSNIKAVHHKFLIRSIVGGASMRTDLVIATPKSTWDNITLTKSKAHALPRMLKFSVDRGVRQAYEALINPETGKPMQIEGKDVYKEIPTARSSFETDVMEIYKLAFGRLEGNEGDLNDFQSFVGVVKQMKKHLNSQQIKETVSRYIELLWGFKGQRGQELERGEPEEDLKVKMPGYQFLIKTLGLPDESGKYIDAYYKTYGLRESLTLRQFINESR